MAADPRTPVLVGVGVASQRCEDPRDAREASELMIAALRAAARDAGSEALLSDAASVRVPRGFWEYSDPGRLVAERLGARGARSVLAELGVLQQTLLNDACTAIASGKEEIALVTGGDAKYRSLRAQHAGVEVPSTSQSGAQPEVTLTPSEPFWSEVEAARGLMMPAQFFSLIESAIRYHAGLSLDAHRDRIAGLWAGMSRVAAGNPRAAHRTPVAAEAIRNPSAANPMIAFPYTKLHNSDWNVDQAAGLILCSLGKARALGLPPERFVYPRAGTESNHVLPVAARAQLHRCPAIACAGERAAALAGLRLDAIDHLDLYSCFPAAVEIFADELGYSLDRPLTVTGGMRFAGGPLNNYVLQATARMAEVLRDSPGSHGLVTAVSGFLNKQGVAIWSTVPPERCFGFADVSAEAAARTGSRPLRGDAVGPAVIAGYTVSYAGSEPAKAIAVCDLPDGTRSVAASEDRELANAMTQAEFCGRSVLLAAGGGFVAGG